MLPTQQLLEKVSKEIKSIPNRRGEHLRKVHYGCFLLCHKSGLRVSEAVSFDLESNIKLIIVSQKGLLIPYYIDPIKDNDYKGKSYHYLKIDYEIYLTDNNPIILFKE